MNLETAAKVEIALCVVRCSTISASESEQTLLERFCSLRRSAASWRLLFCFRGHDDKETKIV
jgi:hypothetical protein